MVDEIKSLLKIAVLFQKKRLNPSKQLSWLSTSIRSDWLWMGGTLGMEAHPPLFKFFNPLTVGALQKGGPTIECWDPRKYIHVILRCIY